ncbi:Benzoylformate decarboxylase [Grifola frondosa]|uniref:Benzoylformate decarboxylase n=1 Tax=Grifola frondosa TaxID=5627 RepID=A0A1C7M4H0_GRIFR|nr:Benzoylformate decarboxylase [Grifola frondosa]
MCHPLCTVPDFTGASPVFRPADFLPFSTPRRLSHILEVMLWESPPPTRDCLSDKHNPPGVDSPAIFCAMYTTASVFFATLARAGLTHAFVNWGSDHSAFLEELERQRVKQGGKTSVQIVTCPNEMVALSAAHGYAQVTGKPAAVIVHVDVGTQALAGAVHNADRGQVPVLIFAGGSPFTANGELRGSKNEWIMWLQDVPDQPAIVRQYMRFTAQIQSGKNAAKVAMRALQIATSHPKGPVYLWARREVTDEEVDPSAVDEALDKAKWPSVTGGGLSPQAVDTLTSALLNAEFPLIITANTGRNPRAFSLLAELSTTLAIGVHTSCKNKFLPEADVVLILDADIPWVDSVGNTPREGARVFVLDTDPLKRTFGWSHIDAEMLCQVDAEVAIGQLLGAVGAPSAEMQSRIAGRTQKFAALHPFPGAGASTIETALAPDGATARAPYVIATLRNAVRAGTPSGGRRVLWMNEAVSNAGIVWDHIQAEEAGSMFMSGGSSLGWALGAAVGGSMGGEVADKGYELIVAIVGDGDYLFGVPSSAYWIARRYNTPFLTIVLNNAGWFSPKSSMMAVYPEGHGSKVSGRQLTVGFGPDMPDYSQIAAAAGGAWARRVERASELHNVFEEAIKVVCQEKRCAVLDCLIESI